MAVNGRRTSDQAGFSLVELLVAMTVLAVVLSGLTAGAITIYRATSTVTLSTDDQNQARTAISVLSRDIRAASPVRPSEDPAFVEARPNDAMFTANLEDSTGLNITGSIRPVLVRLWIDGGRLIEDTTDAEPGTPITWDPAANARVRFIASFVVNDFEVQPGGAVTGTPIFTYFDAAGNELEYSTDPCPGFAGDVAAPCLDEATREQIAVVQLQLVVSSDPSDRVGAFTVEQRVRLPNA